MIDFGTEMFVFYIIGYLGICGLCIYGFVQQSKAKQAAKNRRDAK